MKIKIEDFEKVLGFKFSEESKNKINSYNISLTKLTEEELKDNINFIEELLSKPDIVRAGSHRINDWNFGWGQNSDEFAATNDIRSLIPKYFAKYRFVRFNNEMFKTNNPESELNMLRVLQHYVFEKYCKQNDIKNFYEFGCGTGHNLLALNDMSNNNGNYYGFDWSSSPADIFENIRKNINPNFQFNVFDFTEPNYSVNIREDSIVFTFAALEQIGNKHEKFINFLIEKKPKLCVHLEPVTELLSSDDKLQNLSIRYINKRNYLSNFYNTLKIDKKDKVNILDAKRTTFGSFLLEGYSLIAWRPIV